MKYQKYIEFILFESPSDDEMKKFNNELIINPILKEEYELFLNALERISKIEESIKNDVKLMNDFDFDPEMEKAILDYKNKIGNISISKKTAENHPNKPEAQNTQINRNRKGWFKAAAVLMVFILLPLGIVLKKQYSVNKTIDINQLCYPQYYPSLTRGSSSTSEKEIMTVECFYKGQPDSALLYISSKNITNVIKSYDPLFIPVCMMESGKPQEAVRALSDITCDNLCYSEAQWYLAICHLMMNQNEEAENVLKKLKITDTVFVKAADKILKEIRHHKEIKIIFAPSKYYANKTMMSTLIKDSDK